VNCIRARVELSSKKKTGHVAAGLCSGVLVPQQKSNKVCPGTLAVLATYRIHVKPSGRELANHALCYRFPTIQLIKMAALLAHASRLFCI